MMYATNLSSGLHQQTSSISRRLRAGIAAGVVLGCVLSCTDLRSAPAWREAPEYLDLFAPPAHREAYRAYVSPLGFDDALRILLAEPEVVRPPGAWEPQSLIPFDAFGRAGSYNRWKLAGLYGSQRARVARGPRIDHGQAESWMLVAPYPDPALQRLEPGTLILVLRIPPA